MHAPGVPAGKIMDRMRQPADHLYLIYHEVRAGGSDYSYVIDQEQFSRHLELFAKLQKSDPSCLTAGVTFDDGHRSDRELALPLLEAHGLKAHFFITAGWTGIRSGYMDWNEVRELHEAGHTVGAHGWSHTLLTHCKQEDFEQELLRPRLMLEDKLGTSITTMSLPGGRYNPRVLAACLEAGYCLVFTSHPRKETEPLGPLVGRLNVHGEMSTDLLCGVLEPGSVLLLKLQRQDRIKGLARQWLGDRVYMKLWALLNRQEEESSLEQTSA